MVTTPEDPPELLLRRSDTGHCVLIEPVSQTVVVDESRERAHARMVEILAAKGPAAAPPPAPSAFAFRGRVASWALLVAVAAPLAWLLAIDRRVAQLEAQVAEPSPSSATVNRGNAPPPGDPPRLQSAPTRSAEGEDEGEGEGEGEGDRPPRRSGEASAAARASVSAAALRSPDPAEDAGVDATP
ncbi:MAG: hypothetical protein H6711_03245 [Myxococcales bacterium]|nr:hypothetical protein [Myxococcales bacterium]